MINSIASAKFPATEPINGPNGNENHYTARRDGLGLFTPLTSLRNSKSCPRRPAVSLNGLSVMKQSSEPVQRIKSGVGELLFYGITK